MRGSLPWFLFFMRRQMEAYIGMDYSRGLKMLKEWIETGEILSRTTIRGVESVDDVRMAGVRKTSPLSRMDTDMQAAFDEAREQLTRHRLPTDGEPMSVYHKFDVVRQIFEYTSGYVIPASVTQVPPGLSTWSLPATKVLMVEHVGSYDHLGNAWSAANQYVRYHKMKCRAEPYERYKNSPDDTSVAELRTEICMPLR
jgi:effector-binding domain-containing protein